MSRQPSRTTTGLRQAADEDANNLIWTMRRQGIDVASLATIRWDRRRLLNVALLLAQRHVEHALRPPGPLLGRVTRNQRMDAEDARWTDDAAKEAHHAYNQGHTDSRTMEGRRVYQRRKRRALVEQRMANMDATA